MPELSVATVVAVARDGEHRFSKPTVPEITVVAGIGVEGDAHSGATVQHLSRVRRDPDQPNLRQVHLMHSELFDEVAELGFEVRAGQMGENITTRGIDLLGLARGTVLVFGDRASVEVTGLRNPCVQIDGFERGLLKAVLGHDEDGQVVRRGGIMSIVKTGGVIRPGDSIEVVPPSGAHVPLEVV